MAISPSEIGSTGVPAGKFAFVARFAIRSRHRRSHQPTSGILAMEVDAGPGRWHHGRRPLPDDQCMALAALKISKTDLAIRHNRPVANWSRERFIRLERTVYADIICRR